MPDNKPFRRSLPGTFSVLLVLLLLPLVSPAAEAQRSVPPALSPSLAMDIREAATLSAIYELSQAWLDGDQDTLQRVYHSEVMLLTPTALGPVVGEAAVVAHHAETRELREPVYFYLRQPAFIGRNDYALVLANYEMGERVAGKLVETNGKIVYAAIGTGESIRVVAHALSVNLNSGSYGPMGTALTAQSDALGVFPERLVYSPEEAPTVRLETPGDQLILTVMDRVHDAFSASDLERLMSLGTSEVPFAAGDFSPFYLLGSEAVGRHFVDFFAVASIPRIDVVRPVVRRFGSLGLLGFEYYSEVSMGEELIRSSGHAVYFFDEATDPDTGQTTTDVSGCVEGAFVVREIGDPY